MKIRMVSGGFGYMLNGIFRVITPLSGEAEVPDKMARNLILAGRAEEIEESPDYVPAEQVSEQAEAEEAKAEPEEKPAVKRGTGRRK